MIELTTAGQGASINTVPTGFQLINSAGVNINQSAGTAGSIHTGTVSATPGSIPWALNTPVFGAFSSTLACGNGLGSNPQPCSLDVIDPHFRLAYYTLWNVGVQHAFTGNLSADVSYVGNRGENEPGAIDINSPTPGPSSAALELQRRTYYSKFPYLSQVEWYTSRAFSNYDGLQATLTQRVSHGLAFTAGYTFAESKDFSSADSGSPLAMENFMPQVDYGPSGFDVRHHFAVSLTYLIPGRKGFGQALEGWQVNSAVNIQTALPINPADTSDDLDGTGIGVDRWTMVGNPSAFHIGGPGPLPCYGFSGVGSVPINGQNYTFAKSTFAGQSNCQSVATMPAACVAAATAEPNSPATVAPAGAAPASSAVDNTALFQLYSKGCYMAGSTVIVPPAQGTYGNMGRDSLRAQPFAQWDLSILKDFKFRDRFTAQFRAEAFNILNTTHYALPSSNPAAPNTFGQSQSTPDVGNPVIGSGSPREVQLGLKLIF